jgi:hypothetical protein
VWFILFLAMVIIWLSYWHGSSPFTTMPELVSGIVDELPANEAKRKNLPIDVLSLGRAMRSEEGMSGENARIAVGWACKNKAHQLGISVTVLVIRTSLKDGVRQCPQADGKYSRQEFAKYCTTFNSPNDRDIELSTGILAGSIPDNTGGCTNFDNPKLQDYLARIKPYNPLTKKGYKDAATIKAKREAAGLVAVAIDGTTTRFWRKAS